MFFEIFILFLVIAFFLLWWGWKSKNTGIFSTGGLMIVIVGMLLYATGLTTSNPTNINTVKTIIDGNTVYQTTTIFQTITVSQDLGFQLACFVIMIVGMLGTFVGFTYIKQKGY